jgi:hypothetical protein
MPVTTKMTIIEVRILPRRFKSVIAATAEDMEKKTIGTTMVKSRLRKTSPKGLKNQQRSLKTRPSKEPRIMEKIKSSEKE